MSEDDVKRLLAEATPGPWDNTFYCKRDGSPIETIEDIRETVAGSVDYSARTELFGVSLQDADDDGLCTVVCYTGNGPNAHNNAALIAAAPTIAAAYIEQAAAIARLTEERDRLREALKALHDDIAEYARINNLGGFDNHCMRQARAALKEG